MVVETGGPFDLVASSPMFSSTTTGSAQGSLSLRTFRSSLETSSQREDMALRVSKTFPCTMNCRLVLVELVTGRRSAGVETRGASWSTGACVAASSASILLAELAAGAEGGAGGSGATGTAAVPRAAPDS